jgi:hypothetical protein
MKWCTKFTPAICANFSYSIPDSTWHLIVVLICLTLITKKQSALLNSNETLAELISQYHWLMSNGFHPYYSDAFCIKSYLERQVWWKYFLFFRPLETITISTPLIMEKGQKQIRLHKDGDHVQRWDCEKRWI